MKTSAYAYLDVVKLVAAGKPAFEGVTDDVPVGDFKATMRAWEARRSAVADAVDYGCLDQQLALTDKGRQLVQALG